MRGRLSVYPRKTYPDRLNLFERLNPRAQYLALDLQVTKIIHHISRALPRQLAKPPTVFAHLSVAMFRSRIAVLTWQRTQFMVDCLMSHQHQRFLELMNANLADGRSVSIRWSYWSRVFIVSETRGPEVLCDSCHWIQGFFDPFPVIARTLVILLWW